jgi:hypothetical protein
MSSFDLSSDNIPSLTADSVWRMTTEEKYFPGTQIEIPLIPCKPSLTSLEDESSIFHLRIPLKKTSMQITVKNLYSQLCEALSEDVEDEESYERVVKKGNIILDMDGTLGDNIPEGFTENPNKYYVAKPIPRPGLRRFFRFVFAHYERVSIWTAALPCWYNNFKNTVLLPNMPPGTEFHFERTRDLEKPYIALKPLSEIYELYPEYNESNTTIVDDNAYTFKANIENAVHIKEFFYDKLGDTPIQRKINAAKDRGLFETIEILKSRIYGTPVKLREDSTKYKDEDDDLYN